MAQLSTITTANAIETFFSPGWWEGVFRNDKFLAMMRALGMEESVAPGGTGHSWHINTTGGAPAVYTEGSPTPQAQAQAWARLTQTWTYIWTTIQVSGHAKDALQNGIFNAIEAEMMLAQRDIVDLRNTTFLTGTAGLPTYVDSTTTCAGQARGSATWFESVESNTNTLAGLRAAYRQANDADHAGNTTAHLVSPTILQWYATLAGLPGTSNFVLAQSGSGPMNVDSGFAWSGATFMGKPLFAVPDLTSTEWYGLDFSAGNIKHKIIRPLGLEFHHKEGDSDVYLVTTGSAFVVEMPKWDFKMTGLS